MLILGTVVRGAVLVAFGQAVATGGSQQYLDAATSGSASAGGNLGYALWIVDPVSSIIGALQPVVALQHVLGLATALAVYALLYRWGVWRWLSAVATVPILLGPAMVTGEQLLLPDATVVALVVGAAVALGWTSGPKLFALGLGALFAGVAATLQPLGIALLVVTVGFGLIARRSWSARSTGALVMAIVFAMPLAAYAGWQHSLTDAGDGSGVATTLGVTNWSSPGDGAVPDLITGEAPGRDAWDLAAYQDDAGRRAPIDVLAAYADLVAVPLWLLLAGPVLGLAAALGLGRSRGSRLRAVCALTSLLPLGTIAIAVLTGDVGWHVVLPAIALWPAAGALGLTALLRGRRSASAQRPQIDDVDRSAQRELVERRGRLDLPPVAVVIAAYNEGAGLPRVLDALPDSVCGLATDVIVVDDGSSDDTGAVAMAHGRAHVVRCETNRGQGAALRLGYRVAREHGAEFIITTDADGQYDTADFPIVLAPVLDGRADFVTGSRRLGRQHTFDRFRRLGVHVFAWSVTAMVGQRLTDTSFGLRAMRADVTGDVTLNQPQYQSSELLLGMFSHGYRVLEVPGTMHLRSAGSTKKGRNLVYGTRYARVVFGTWWREGCPRPVADVAPALGGRSSGRPRAQAHPVDLA